MASCGSRCRMSALLLLLRSETLDSTEQWRRGLQRAKLPALGSAFHPSVLPGCPHSGFSCRPISHHGVTTLCLQCSCLQLGVPLVTWVLWVPQYIELCPSASRAFNLCRFCCCSQAAPGQVSAPQAVGDASVGDRGPAEHRCRAGAPGQLVSGCVTVRALSTGFLLCHVLHLLWISRCFLPVIKSRSRTGTKGWLVATVMNCGAVCGHWLCWVSLLRG